MTAWSESIRVPVSWEWLKAATPLSLKIRPSSSSFCLKRTPLIQPIEESYLSLCCARATVAFAILSLHKT